MSADDPATPDAHSAPSDGAADAHEADTQTSSPEPDPVDEGFWSVYWERFRRQQVDDPVEERREGLWDRFQRQQVDDPVDARRSRRSP